MEKEKIRDTFLFKNFGMTLISLIAGVFLISIPMFLNKANLTSLATNFVYLMVGFNFLFEAINFKANKKETKEKESKEEKKKTKILWYVVIGIVSIVLAFFTTKTVDMQYDFHDQIMYRVLITLSQVSTLMRIYVLYKKSDLTFGEFALSSFLQVCTPFVVTIIAMFVFNFFFCNTSLAKMTLAPVILTTLNNILWGIYLFPAFISSISNKEVVEDKKTNFVLNEIVSMLLLGFTYLLVLYGLFCSSSTSSNAIAILIFSSLGIEYFYTIILSNTKEFSMKKYVQMLPYILIGILALAYIILARSVKMYGLTFEKYMAIMLFVLACIYDIMYLFVNKHIGKILIISSILVICANLAPYVNVTTVTIDSQVKKLQNILAKDEIKAIDVENGLKAKYYLMDSKQGSKLLEEIDTSILNEQILEQEENIETGELYYYGAYDQSQIDVSKYTSLNYVTYMNTNKSEAEVFENCELTDQQTVISNANLKELLEKISSIEKTSYDLNEEEVEVASAILKEMNPIKVGDADLYVNALSIAKNNSDGNYVAVGMSGVLMK